LEQSLTDAETPQKRVSTETKLRIKRLSSQQDEQGHSTPPDIQKQTIAFFPEDLLNL